MTSSGAYPTPTQHQTYQAMPRLDTPISDPETGLVTIPWYRVFVDFFNRTGAGVISSINSALVTQTPGQPVKVVTPSGNEILTITVPGGSSNFTVETTTMSGGGRVALVPGASPWVWQNPTTVGLLIVADAQVEFSRDGVTYDLWNLMGGTVRMLVGDRVRLTWFGPATPKAIFYPDQ